MAQDIKYKVLTAFEFEEIGNSEWKITKYIGFDEENIEIPAQIGDKKIVAIGEELFARDKRIKRVKIDTGIKIIENNAFLLCESLEQIVLPNTLEIIGEYAFRGTAISELVLPSSVVKLGKGVCSYCTGDDEMGEKISTGLVKVELSEGLTEIPDEAFNSCIALTHINIPKNIKRIGKKAFEYCKKLTPFGFHEGLQIIGERAFGFTFMDRDDEGDNSFGMLLLPKSIKHIEKGAFENCNIDEIAFIQGCQAKLEKGAFASVYPNIMYIPGSITKIGEIFLGTHHGRYEDKKRDEDGKVVHDAWGNDVYEERSYHREEDQFSEEMIIYCELGSPALSFAKSKGIKCADYESNFYQFYEHQKQYKEDKEKREAEQLAKQKEKQERLDKIAKETAIASAAFEAEQNKLKAARKEREERKQLADAEYEQKKKEFSPHESLCAEDIGTGLTSIVIPSHIKVIKEDAFKYNRNIQEIVFEPNSQLVRLERRSMCGLCELEKIKLPASLREIEDQAFYATKYLSTVKFEKGCQLQRIGNEAFYMTGQLGYWSFDMPLTVKRIGSKAFWDCGLSKVQIPRGCQIEEDSFEKDTKIIWVEPNLQQEETTDPLTDLVNTGVQKLKSILNKFKK